MTTALEYFKKGFECTKMPEFKHLLLVIIAVSIIEGILSAIIPIIPTILMGFFTTFYLWEKVLAYQGEKIKKLGEFEVNNIIAYIKLWFMRLIIIFFNWIQRKILFAQIISYLMIIIGALGLSAEGNSIFSAVLLVIGIISASVLLFYNTLRFSLAIPIRLIEMNGTIESFKRSWEITKGRAWTIFLIELLYSLFKIGVVLIIIAAIVILYFVLFGNGETTPGLGAVIFLILAIFVGGIILILANAYFNIFYAFVFVNYYISIKEENKATKS
jgi:hypothetical protein